MTDHESENLCRIHRASMEILRGTGMRFLHPDAIQVLRSNGVRVEDDTAHFTEEQVMEWVGKAPSVVCCVAAEPQFNVCVGDGTTHYATAGGPTMIMEADGTLRPSTTEDYIRLVKLYEQNDRFSLNGGLCCQPEDLPVEWATPLLYYLALRHSRKVVWTAGGDYRQMEIVFRLCMARFGLTEEELKAEPHTMAIVNTNTPLQLDVTMTETLFAMLKYRQPVVITAAAMAGTTSPATLAGTIAIANAEVLAAITLAQMYAPGAPVIYGSQSSNADMASCAMAIGSPEGALCYRYAALLAHKYGLPCRAGGSLTDALALDMQAGWESMLTCLASRESGVDVMFQSAGITAGYLAVSFEKLIADFEIIDAVEQYLGGVRTEAEELPLELIRQTGPGGDFLAAEHTLRHCRNAAMTPHISVRGNSGGSAALGRRVERRMDQLLQKYQGPELSEETTDRMRQTLHQYGVAWEEISRLDLL